MKIVFIKEGRKGIENIAVPVDVMFREDTDKGVVVAVANLNGDEAFKVADRILGVRASEFLSLHSPAFYHEVVMPRNYHAVARCSKEDDFSLEEGRLIASRRIEHKLHQMIQKRVIRIAKHLEKCAEKMKTVSFNVPQGEDAWWMQHK